MANCVSSELYRGLARISIAQYQAWMSELLKNLQADPRTASLSSGVVIADLSGVAYLFENLLRFMTPALAQQPPGWAKDKYLNVIVALTLADTPEKPD